MHDRASGAAVANKTVLHTKQDLVQRLLIHSANSNAVNNTTLMAHSHILLASSPQHSQQLKFSMSNIHKAGCTLLGSAISSRSESRSNSALQENGGTGTDVNTRTTVAAPANGAAAKQDRGTQGTGTEQTY